MSENLEHKIDREGWPAGEWDNEPDRHDFIYAGFSCFILRNNIGNWCGYVGIPSSHPLYSSDSFDDELSVHGGITYRNKCDAPICHIPQPGMPDDVMWLGFDTAHYMDYSPGMAAYRKGILGDESGIYRNMAYTIDETKSLAEQLRALESK